MGKGDKKSKRGKITIGSYGVRRKRKKSSGIAAVPKKAATATAAEAPEEKPAKKAPAKAAAKPAAEKKPAAKKAAKPKGE